ncbi:hypothetical protein [Limosilactobacillus sp.]|uniref:hypothetical protein n=1 Tax=Limosilactobacillus sp. TaxID=2773925 RepID=UPI003EFC0A5B
MEKQFWLIDYNAQQVSLAFLADKTRRASKVTLTREASQQVTDHFLAVLTKLRASKRYYYLAFASRFWEMPLLVLAKRKTSREIIDLVNQRQKVLTSLDSPFKVINHHPHLWNQDEISQLADWQHNECFLDIRTLDGRIDHGELSRYDRYLCQLGYPQVQVGMALKDRVGLRLLNLQRLFNTPLFQECWQQHRLIMRQYYDEITKNPHEEWQGMMKIMPTTTDAETIEAILYRDHHIVDRHRIDLVIPTMTTRWGQLLGSFYQNYVGIDRHDPYALHRVHLKNKDFRPPLLYNPDHSPFVLIPSEGGLHGFTVDKEAFATSHDYQQSNLFSEPNHAQQVIKIDHRLLPQDTLLAMGAFDPHAQGIVQQMVNDVRQHANAPTLTSKLEQKLLHAMKGSSDTAFDNHLKQPNTILQMRLTVQLKLIALCELLLDQHFKLLSVNSTVVYVTPPAGADLKVLDHLPAGFHVTDRGTNWFGKSPNDHVYQSYDGRYQVAGDNTNHFYGPNNWTDQQRPTITEKVLVEYLMRAGNHRPVNQQLIGELLERHRQEGFQPAEWFQPILSSKLKQLFAIADNGQETLVATPALTGYFTSNPHDYTVTRVFSTHQRGDAVAEELAERGQLREKFNITRPHFKVEQRQIFARRHLRITFTPAEIIPQELQSTLDLAAYQQIVEQMLATWLPRRPRSTTSQLQLEI